MNMTHDNMVMVHCKADLGNKSILMEIIRGITKTKTSFPGFYVELINKLIASLSVILVSNNIFCR